MLTDEQLKGKYIRYIPEITEEIFNKIVAKFNKYGIDCDYKGFKRWGYLNFEYHNLSSKELCIQTMEAANGYTEISYKDIIGEVISEYVECTISDTDEYTLGKIYKLEKGKIRTNKDYLPDSLYKPGEKYYDYTFKPSTEEEYNKQSKPKQVEKPKFEVGKWYKNLGDGSYVGKLCGEVTNSRFPCKEYLNGSGKYTSFGVYFSGFEKAVEAAYEDYGKYLPDGHPDKIIKKEYMNTMNIEVGDTVKCVSEKGISKFGKGNNGAGWESNLEFIVASIDNHGKYNIYFRSERGNGVYSDAVTLVKRKEQSKSFEVHDKCNIGDIIVTTEVPKDVTSRKNGDLHQVLQKSDSEFLYYGTTLCIGGRNKDTYRLATPEEVKMYNEGIRNINDVKKEEDYKVGDWCYVISAGISQLENGKVYQINEVDLRSGVQKHHFDNGSGLKNNRCWLYTYEFRKATSEEITKVTGNKDFVLPELWCIKVTEENKDVLGKWRTSGGLGVSYGYCVNKFLTCRDVGYWYRDKPAVYVEITFEQFKKYVLKENVSEGEKVNEFVEGQWYKHVNSKNSFSYYQGNNKGCGFWKGVWKEEIITSNPSEWKSCTINDVKELLFDEARTRYPLGCEYKGVSENGSTTSSKYKPTEIKPYIHGRNSIALQELKGLVYANGVWAVVVPKGSSEEITSYDGLKVGDVLPEKIINDWGNKDYNWISLYNDSPTWGKSGGFIGDRYIKSFKNIDGHISFLVSDTNQVYLKAKGFKSFMESYTIKTDKGILEQVPSLSSLKNAVGEELRKGGIIFEYPFTPKESYKRNKLELKKFNVKKLI